NDESLAYRFALVGAGATDVLAEGTPERMAGSSEDTTLARNRRVTVRFSAPGGTDMATSCRQPTSFPGVFPGMLHAHKGSSASSRPTTTREKATCWEVRFR